MFCRAVGLTGDRTQFAPSLSILDSRFSLCSLAPPRDIQHSSRLVLKSRCVSLKILQCPFRWLLLIVSAACGLRARGTESVRICETARFFFCGNICYHKSRPLKALCEDGMFIAIMRNIAAGQVDDIEHTVLIGSFFLYMWP